MGSVALAADRVVNRMVDGNELADASVTGEENSPPAVRVWIDPEIEFTPMQVAGVTMARCVHRGTGVHFQFGAAEHHVATLTDGNRSVTDIVEQANADGLDWSPQDVADFIGVLVAQKIAIASVPAGKPPQPASSEHGSPRETRPTGPTQPSPPASGRLAKTLLTQSVKWCGYAISLRFPLVHGNPWAERLLPVVRPLLGGFGLIGGTIVIAGSVGFSLYHRGDLASELMRIFDSNQWLMMLVAWMILKVIHEFGHACMARYYDVRVGRAGVMFFLFAPLAYVDVTDAWKLPRRRHRIAIALGGVYFELLCASVALWVWWLNPGGVVAHVAAQVFFLAGPATLLVNANPLLRLDGYYVVADLVDIPNLREQGRRLLGGSIERWLFSIDPPASHLSGWRRPFAFFHALASIVFQIVWMGGLVIVVSMWAGPIGLLVAGCALFLWTVLPTGRWFAKMWFYDGGEGFSIGTHRRRILWVALTVITIGQFFITLPSPLVVEVPAVARFADDQVLRSPASGFIRHVYLGTGYGIRAGEVILEIENDELVVQRDELELEILSEAIVWQQNQHQQSLGLAEAANQRGESLKRKLAELNEQVAAMQVKSTRDGEILTPELLQLAGRFVDAGQEIVQIGNRNDKELLLSIGEKELDAYQDAVENREQLRVCFRGGGWIDVIPQPIRPRASVNAPHPALAATSGGPLTVVPESDPSTNTGGPGVELIAPRFEAIVLLPPGQADTIRSGEVGMLALQDRRSLARRFWQWFKGDPER